MVSIIGSDHVHNRGCIDHFRSSHVPHVTHTCTRVCTTMPVLVHRSLDRATYNCTGTILNCCSILNHIFLLPPHPTQSFIFPFPPLHFILPIFFSSLPLPPSLPLPFINQHWTSSMHILHSNDNTCVYSIATVIGSIISS